MIENSVNSVKSSLTFYSEKDNAEPRAAGMLSRCRDQDRVQNGLLSHERGAPRTPTCAGEHMVRYSLETKRVKIKSFTLTNELRSFRVERRSYSVMSSINPVNSGNLLPTGVGIPSQLVQ
jgi:hypothetical protein